MMNDDLDDVLSRIALHVENDVAEAEPTMFDDADVVFSRKLKRLKMWGWPEQYCKLKLPFASVEDVDAERKAGMLRGLAAGDGREGDAGRGAWPERYGQDVVRLQAGAGLRV